MAEFVRICPKCGTENPEYEAVCTSCDQFIGMESAVPAPASPKPETGGAPPEAQTHVPPATQRYVPVADSFFLQLPDGVALLTVRSGAVLGQAHPSSDADLQLPAEVEGSGFVHRRHCRFELRDGRWRVTAIDQSTAGSPFTNPTFVNQHRVSAGAARELSDGDELRLSGVTLIVRMV